MLELLPTLAAIAAIWFAATVTPGPDFLVTTRVALAHGRDAARRTVLGVALGTAAWGLAGFFGIHALFLAAPWLYLGLKLLAGGYLCWLGVALLWGSVRPAPSAAEGGGASALPPGSAFRLGLVTNIANPKAALFTTSMFAATLPAQPPAWLGFAATAVMVGITLGWYALVARLLTTRRVADAYARARAWVDRVAGAAFVAFGARLAWDARTG